MTEPAPLLPAKTAALLLIGNELLSGKVEEANLAVLARVLRDLGVELQRVVMVQDDIEIIAREVKALSSTHDWLFTSGGIGPTHDDVTIDAVALAFGVPVVQNETMADMIRGHYKERCNEGHLRMALAPDGAIMETTKEMRWPTVRMHNTWVMPGIPEAFRMKLPVIVERLGGAAPYISRAVYTKMDEADLKPLLDATVAEFPDVIIGSYPKWNEPTYKTKLTFDSRDTARVSAATDAFVARLPKGEPQRTE